MAYDVEITDEAALKAAHPDLFKINERALKKRLIASKTLGQTIPGAKLVHIVANPTPPVPIGRVESIGDEANGTRSFIAEHAAKESA